MISNEVKSRPVGEAGAAESEKTLGLDRAVSTTAPLYTTLLRRLLCWKE